MLLNPSSFIGFEDYIEIAFDKYMDADTLTASNIALAGRDFDITLMDAEEDPLVPDYGAIRKPIQTMRNYAVQCRWPRWLAGSWHSQASGKDGSGNGQILSNENKTRMHKRRIFCRKSASCKKDRHQESSPSIMRETMWSSMNRLLDCAACIRQRLARRLILRGNPPEKSKMAVTAASEKISEGVPAA